MFSPVPIQSRSIIHAAHEEYYYAGVLHGNVTKRNIMISETPNGERKGVLLDLDQCITYQTPYVAGLKISTPESTKGKEAASKESSD